MKTLIENNSLIVESKTAGRGAHEHPPQVRRHGIPLAARPEVWPGQSPVLFPFVCAVADNKYTYEGKQYEMKNHGFARKRNSSLSSWRRTRSSYKLVSTEETYRNYPFKFSLQIGYALHGNALAVGYAGAQRRQQAHVLLHRRAPGFRCPIAAGRRLSRTITWSSRSPRRWTGNSWTPPTC